MATEPSGMLIPAYVWPDGGAWDVLGDVASAMRPGGLLVVANHNNGHFENEPQGAIQLYDKAIRATRKTCTPVLGYVHDCYANTKTDSATCPRPTLIMSDVDRWFNTYGVDGIFIDQVSHHHPGRAESLVTEIQARRSDALIVLNPGSTPDEKFVEDTNPAIVVVRETEFANFANWPAMTDEPWIANRTNPPVDGEIKAGRMAIIAHTIPNPADVDVLIAKAEEYRIGWIHAQYTPEHPADYNAFSVHLPLLARRLDKCARWGCILPFGYLFCKIGNAILCLGSQTAELLRTAIGRRLRR